MNAFEDLLIGQAPEFLSVVRAAHIVAATDVTVLISGETGTGKELLANAMHRESKRNHTPFTTINCAALPENLVESELFGHRQGAFTGAVRDQVGRVQAAHGGTLFLDEIGELPLSVQAKLLRFLELGECQAVGVTRNEKADVRIFAAANQDLFKQVQAGRFREDLYYRLHVVPLELPPLRERRSDIELLVNTLSSHLAKEHQLEAPRYSSDAMEALLRYDWPGNVRELRNICERLLVLFSGKTIQLQNLPIEIRKPHTEANKGSGFALPDAGIRLEELEASMIHQALNKSNGNQSKAARLLGLTRSTLIYRMKKFAIQ